MAGVPSVLVEESQKCRCAFIGCGCWAWIAGGVEETSDQCLVTAALIVGCEEGLGGAERGAGFVFHRNCDSSQEIEARTVGSAA